MGQQKSLAKNSIYNMLYSAINIAFPLFTGIYVARVLLPENVGEVAAAQNLAQYFVILAFLGIPAYGMREISKCRNDAKELSKVYSELFAINLCSTILFLLVYIAIIIGVPQYSENLKLYLITGIIIALNALRIDWLYEGLEEFRYISIRNIAFKLVSFALLVAFVKGPSDYYWYAGITVIGTAGNYVLNIFHSHSFVKLSVNNLNLKRHMRPILYLTAVNLAIELYSLVDVTMLNAFCDKANVAYYSYGSRVYKMLLQIINSFTVVVVPRMTLYYRENKKDEFYKLISNTLALIALLALPMIAGLLFTAKDIMVLLYTDAYINSGLVIQILCPLLLISPIGYLLGSRVLLVTANESKMLICVAVGAVVNIIGNYFLIQTHNEYGAAAASVISEIVVMCIYVCMGAKYIKIIGISKEMLKIAIATLIMTVSLLFCRGISGEAVRVCIEVIVGATTYCIALCIMKERIALRIVQKVLHRKDFP